MNGIFAAVGEGEIHQRLSGSGSNQTTRSQYLRTGRDDHSIQDPVNVLIRESEIA